MKIIFNYFTRVKFRKEDLLNKPVFNWIKEDNWYLRSELGE